LGARQWRVKMAIMAEKNTTFERHYFDD